MGGGCESIGHEEDGKELKTLSAVANPDSGFFNFKRIFFASFNNAI